MRIRVLSLLAFVTLLWPANAQAGSISLDTFFQGSGAIFVVAGDEESFEIGSISVSQALGLGSLDALPSFEAYCVDFRTSIFSQTDAPLLGLGTYNAERDSMILWTDPGTATLPQVPLVATGSGQRAAWLYSEYAGTFADPTTDLGKQQRGALQMAIWNALYDSDFTVAANNDPTNRTYFKFSGDLDLLPLAEFYLHGDGVTGGLEHAGPDLLLADAAWLRLTYTSGKDAQDLVGPTGSSTTPVPEPGAGLLLGMGITALAAFRSRKSLLHRG